MKAESRKQRAESPKRRSSQEIRALNWVRVTMACLARDAAAHVLEEDFPYACNSLKWVVDRFVPADRRIEYRLLMLGVFSAFFRPRTAHVWREVWWKDGERSVRAVALLLMQRMIERASLNEVEEWVLNYSSISLLATEALTSEALTSEAPASGKEAA